MVRLSYRSRDHSASRRRSTTASAAWVTPPCPAPLSLERREVAVVLMPFSDDLIILQLLSTFSDCWVNLHQVNSKVNSEAKMGWLDTCHQCLNIEIFFSFSFLFPSSLCRLQCCESWHQNISRLFFLSITVSADFRCFKCSNLSGSLLLLKWKQSKTLKANECKYHSSILHALCRGSPIYSSLHKILLSSWFLCPTLNSNNRFSEESFYVGTVKSKEEPE